MGDLGGESPLKVEKLYSSQVGLEDPKGPSTFQARRCELPECRAAHGKSSLFPLTTQNVIFYDQDILYMTFENLTHLSSKMLNILEIFFFFFFFFFFAWPVSVHRIGSMFIGPGAKWKCRPLFKSYWEFLSGDSRVLSQVQGPSEQRSRAVCPWIKSPPNPHPTLGKTFTLGTEQWTLVLGYIQVRDKSVTSGISVDLWHLRSLDGYMGTKVLLTCKPLRIVRWFQKF